MADNSTNERCLVCNSLLASNGRCPSCDAVTIAKHAALDVEEVVSRRNQVITQPETEFQTTEGEKKGALSPAFLFNKMTKERFELSSPVSKVGRDRSNNIQLPGDHYISRYHAWVLHNKGKFWVEDVGSANGTLLNGRPLTTREQLAAGDRLTFGKTELIFVVD